MVVEELARTATLGAPLAGATLQRDVAAGDTAVAAAADTGRSYPIGAVLGSYRLLQQIGAGGMGRVFIAEHVLLGRRVALKVLRSEYSGNREAVQRFFAEARAVNCINHENIIEVSDFVEGANGPSFYIMELLCGIDLRTLEEREGVLPLPRALNIALQVCRGVGAAHDAGVIHRDLKPDNIFLIERGEHREFVKLLDFGVAKLTNAELDQAKPFETSAGIVVGTPDYMAPEQAYGQEVDQRCDIYALGLILFEMVAGRRPFLGRTAREVMVQHMTVEPPRPSQLNPSYGLPPELEELILACLRKDPRDRPATIQDVEMRLAVILDQVRSTRAHARSRSSARARRGRGWLAMAGVLMLALSGGLFMWSQGVRPDVPIARAEGLVRAFRHAATAEAASAPAVETSAAVTEPGTAPATTAEDPGRTGRLTILPMATGTEPATRPAAEPARIAAPPEGRAPAEPPRAAPSPPRRKVVKLDHDSVINPFE